MICPNCGEGPVRLQWTVIQSTIVQDSNDRLFVVKSTADNDPQGDDRLICVACEYNWTPAKGQITEL
jgi:hypothetical protein